MIDKNNKTSPAISARQFRHHQAIPEHVGRHRPKGPFADVGTQVDSHVGKRPCGPMPTYNFYRFIENPIEDVGWRHCVAYPTYLFFPFSLLPFFGPPSANDPAGLCRPTNYINPI